MPAHFGQSPNTPPKEAASADAIDFRALYYTLRERLWLIVLCLLLAALGTAAYLMRAPKIFAATVVLQVEQEEQNILNIQRVQQEDPQSLEFLKTVEHTLQTRSLLGRVLDTNRLAANPAFVTPVEGAPPPTREQLITQLSKTVKVKLRKGTRLLDVTVRHTDPEIAALIGNSLFAEYLSQNVEYNSQTAHTAQDFLRNEETRLKINLQESEQAMQEYKERTKSVSLEDRQNVVVEKLKELNQKVTEAKSQRILHETAFLQASRLSNNPAALITLPAVAADATVSDLRGTVAQLESELANLRQRYKSKHPKYIQTVSQLGESRSALTNAIYNVPHVIRSQYESALSTERALQAALIEQETAALALNKQSLHYNALAREVESDRTLYEAVQNRIKENILTKDISPSKVRVIQPATPAERPVSPRRFKVALLGLFVGLGSGFLLALLHNSLDRSLKSVDQTEDYLGVPVLSAIPKFSGVAASQRKLINSADANSGEAEAFRTLRTALSMLGHKESRRVSLFTSAVPSEGKTFCSLNYAISLAQQGLRTLIVDCDLRRPMVEQTLVNNNKRGFGLTDYLTGEKDFQSIVHNTDTKNFSYIPAGTTTPNPAELLAQTGIDSLVDEALLQFDRVIIDSAPIHAVSDTLLILNRVQTLCLVIRSGKTPRNSVFRAVQMLKEAGAPLAGVILNLLPRARNGYGYHYDSYYSYGYYGKYADQEQKERHAEAA